MKFYLSWCMKRMLRFCNFNVQPKRVIFSHTKCIPGLTFYFKFWGASVYHSARNKFLFQIPIQIFRSFLLNTFNVLGLYLLADLILNTMCRMPFCLRRIFDNPEQLKPIIPRLISSMVIIGCSTGTYEGLNRPAKCSIRSFVKGKIYPVRSNLSS